MTLDAEDFIRRFLLHVLAEMASCVSVTSAFWPTAPKNTPSLNAENCWDSIPHCLKSPKTQPGISWWNLPASILIAVLVARRE